MKILRPFLPWLIIAAAVCFPRSMNAAAGDIKISYKASNNTTWIDAIFAKSNNGLLGMDGTGIPSAVTAGSGVSISGGVISATGSGGTVTGFSAGNLSPLFTTSVATSTTTPALSFSLSNASANTVLAGPTTGSAAAPTFRALVAADVPAPTEIHAVGTTGPVITGTLNSGGALPTPYSTSQVVVQIGNTSGTSPGVLLDGSSAAGLLEFRRAAGTIASPSALLTGTIIGDLGWRGYGATGFTNRRAEVVATTTEGWTDSAQGTTMDFNVTATGGTTTASGLNILSNKMTAPQEIYWGNAYTMGARLSYVSTGSSANPAIFTGAGRGFTIGVNDTNNTGLTIASTGIATFSSSIAATGVTDSGLTSGRVPFTSTGGLLADSSAFLFNSGTGALTATSYALGTTTPGTINGSSGAVTVTSAGTNQPISLFLGGTAPVKVGASGDTYSSIGTLALGLGTTTAKGLWFGNELALYRSGTGALTQSYALNTTTYKISSGSGGALIVMDRSSNVESARLQFSTAGTVSWSAGMFFTDGSASTGFHISPDNTYAGRVFSLTTAGAATFTGTVTTTNTTEGTTGGAGSIVTSGGIYAAKAIVSGSTTASTNTTTGSGIFGGGLGVAGAIYAGSIQNTPIGSTTASTGAFTTVSASGKITVTGANIRLSNNFSLSANLVAGTETPLISRNTSDKVVIDADGFGTLISNGVGAFSSTGLAVTGTVVGTFNGAAQYGGDFKDSTDTSGAGFVVFRKSDGTQIGGISRVAATDAVSYNTTSDVRLKTDFQAWSLGDDFDRIPVGSFRWKADGSLSHGTLAQELYRVFPDAVTKGDDSANVTKRWMVDYSKLTVPLIAEVQSLRARVKTLENAPHAAPSFELRLFELLALAAFVLALRANLLRHS